MKLHELSSYLLLVSFAIQSPQFISEEIITSIKASPFDGIAVPYVSPYHADPVNVNETNDSFEQLASHLKKEVWPWVFLNRVVGYDPEQKGKFKPKKLKFSDLEGIHIMPDQERAVDFLKLWKNALLVAKNTESPGIVLDLEPYNNKQAYRISYLSKKMDKSDKQIREYLREFGQKMAEIAFDTYPSAKVHLLYSGLTSKKLFAITQWEKRSVSYIVEGMLNFNETNKLTVSYYSGGELTLGYCNLDLEHLQEKISVRKKKFAKYEDKYAGLKLSAPVAPWLDVDSRSGWMTRGNCGKSRLRTIKDFASIFNEIKSTYNFTWIYLAGHSGFKLNDIDSMAKLYEVLNAP